MKLKKKKIPKEAESEHSDSAEASDPYSISEEELTPRHFRPPLTAEELIRYKWVFEERKRELPDNTRK